MQGRTKKIPERREEKKGKEKWRLNVRASERGRRRYSLERSRSTFDGTQCEKKDKESACAESFEMGQREEGEGGLLRTSSIVEGTRAERQCVLVSLHELSRGRTSTSAAAAVDQRGEEEGEPARAPGRAG